MNWWWAWKPLTIVLLPLSLVFAIFVALRKFLYKIKLLPSYRAPVTVIVVGNITVGGTGKTPFTISLVQALTAQGYKPGILTRGYKNKAPHYPFVVQNDSKVTETGDEALLLKRHTNAPVYVDAKRTRAIKQMFESEDVDVVVCDDGLQHYALQRDIEIIVIDSGRMFGNCLSLPAGPLREPLSRCEGVDYIVCNGAAR